MLTIFSRNQVQKSLPFYIFLFFFLLTFAIRLSSPSLSSGDDPYYHARRSASIWQGEKVSLPFSSTLGEHPVDLYALYHLSIALFTLFFHGTNYKALIMGDKIYHSLLDAFLFLVFFLVACAFGRKLDEKNSTTLALIGTFLLFATSHIFTFRILLERPHILSIIWMLAVFWCCIDKKTVHLFFLFLLFPFLYSTSFLLLIPPFLFAFAYLLYYGISGLRDALWPSIVSLGGLTLGIILRPDTLSYVYNGYIVHILSIYRALFTKAVGMPAELGIGVKIIESDFYWVGVFIVLSICAFALLRKRSIHALSFAMWYLVVVGFSFFIGFCLVERTIEYAFPFALLFILYAKPIIVFTREEWRNFKDSYPKIGLIVHELAGAFRERRQFFIIFGIITLVLFFSAETIASIRSMRRAPSYAMYEETSLYLRSHTSVREHVYIPRFGMFPQLFFYNPTLAYSSGMDPTFTYLYDEERYWKSIHFNAGDLICGEAACTIGIDPYDFLKDELNVRYVVIDTNYFIDTTKPSLIMTLNDDERFSLAFHDPDFPNMYVYGFSGNDI